MWLLSCLVSRSGFLFLFFWVGMEPLGRSENLFFPHVKVRLRQAFEYGKISLVIF